MRIGLVLDYFDSRRGGVEQWTRQLSDRLLRAGHEVHVAATGFGVAEADSGIVPHRFPPHHNREARAASAERVLRTLPLDVIHDMGVGWYCDILQPHGGTIRAAFEQNLLLVPAWLRQLKRASASWLPRYRDFEKVAARQYANERSLVLAISKMVEKDLIRFHQIPPERIRLVYNGVDTERYSPCQHDIHREEIRDQLRLRDKVVFLIVAHNLKLKGVPALLHALKTVTHISQNVALVIVGGKRIMPYRRLAEQLGIGSCVRFAGPADDAVPYYAAADVYVQPTFYDPCSLVVLEALASGLPVITTSCNGAGELMASGEHGFIYDDPADADTLADRMIRLLDAGRRERMSTAARQLALKHTFDDNVEQILAVYREVLDRKHNRGERRSFAA